MRASAMCQPLRHITKPAASPVTYILVILIFLNSHPAQSADAPIEFRNLQNPYIKEALFELYQEKYSSAIGILLSERWRKQFGNEQSKAELLLAYLYTSYGMYDEAYKVLKKLRVTKQDTHLKNTLWLEVAKSYFRTNQLVQAEKVLGTMDKNLSADLERARDILRAQLYISQNQYKQAKQVLLTLKDDTHWDPFGYYNLGVTLVKSGKQQQGITWLSRVADMNAANDEMLALRDKTNFTLGYIYLQQRNTQQAKNYFQKVRLHSPFSNKAIYGLGLVYSELEEYKPSLAAWLELVKRNKHDRVVLEALLAAPFTYSVLGAYEQSIEQYQKSLELFKSEQQKLDKIISDVKRGKLITTLLKYLTQNGLESRDEMNTIPNIPEAPYLTDLYEDRSFHEALQNYKDLYILQNRLKLWSGAIDNIENMSLAFKKVYVDKINIQQAQVISAEQELKQDISRIILHKLLQHRDLLSEYSKQALFGIAQNYDRISLNH